MEPSKNDPFAVILILFLLILLGYAGFLAYKSIQWDVLDRLEAQPLTLPPPATSSATIISPASPSTPSAQTSP